MDAVATVFYSRDDGHDDSEKIMVDYGSSVRSIEEAISRGLFVFYSNRQGILAAVYRRPNDVPAKGFIWVQRESDRAWEYIEASSVTITTEQRKKDRSMPEGKRHGGRTPHLRAVKKQQGAAQQPKSEGDAAEAAPATPKAGAPQASFKRAGKQGELPGVTTGERRSPEIEEAAERWEDTKLAKAKATKAHQEADDILVTVMRKKKRTRYSRTTFGVVEVPDPKIHARFSREKKEPVKKSKKK